MAPSQQFQAYISRSKIMLNAGKIEEALQDAEEAIEAQPSNVLGYMAKYKALSKSGSMDKAVAALLDGHAKIPGDTKLHVYAITELQNKATASQEAGDHDAAISHSTSAMSIVYSRLATHKADPLPIRLLVDLLQVRAYSYKKADLPFEAIKDLHRAIRIAAKTNRVFLHEHYKRKALLLAELGLLQEALRDAEAAVRNATGIAKAEAFLTKGIIFFNQGRCTESIATYEAGLVFNPQSLQLHNALKFSKELQQGLKPEQVAAFSRVESGHKSRSWEEFEDKLAKLSV